MICLGPFEGSLLFHMAPNISKYASRIIALAMYSFNVGSSTVGKKWVSLSTQCVGAGEGGTVSMLARVSLVDYRGKTIVDTYVKPTMPVVSYRTPYTGIEAHHLENGVPFNHALALVTSSVDGKIVVGHSLWQDFYALGIAHPASDTRDNALFLPFRAALSTMNSVVGLETLMYRLMRRLISTEHVNSLENARACMDLFRSAQDEWERIIDSGEWPCALPPALYARCYS
ncbi:hypothetical protein BS47DRAFT_492039 [Hydnum rufescens UP504]|uniref:Exonuclease domain-containing protein n=1 Tax=Hydnum rufescens UP504 TaxID=1448309 RepID=A0A9P6AI80_9AGAM|nr:hypothetical protein BS47DRAFT_492039 [Hydnum rufescens UP504]